MTVHVALLRAVNLGSHRRVATPALREVVARLGIEDVRTLLQSGNVVFRGGPSAGAELERALEEACAKRLGLETEVFVRTAKQWRAMVAGNPFPEEAARDPAHLLVIEKRLGMRGTGRNWNTVLRLAALAED